MNWGKGITIFIISFMLFIAFFVYKAFTMNADLIDEDYYENELAFDQNKSEKFNYTNMGGEILVDQKESGVIFSFPDNLNAQTKGTIAFYRPEDKRFDREFDLAVGEDQLQKFDYDNFVEGFYQIKVNWKDAAGKGYIFESEITFQ